MVVQVSPPAFALLFLFSSVAFALGCRAEGSATIAAASVGAHA